MAVNDTATLYDEQIAAEMPGRLVKMMDLSGADYAMGQVQALYSELASFVAGGATGDTLQYCKLPPGTYIVGGWFYAEDGLIADGSHVDLGVVYEAGDGTDDVDALIDGMDVFDGTDSAPLAALPTGGIHMIPQDVAVAPYQVTGGWGTVTLTSVGSALITAKITKLVLFVILPA